MTDPDEMAEFFEQWPETAASAEPGLMDSAPTPAALAAKAFMERIDNETYQRIIKTRAHLGGWVGAREAGLWDVKTCDAITDAALGAVMDLFRSWAAECDEAPAAPGP